MNEEKGGFTVADRRHFDADGTPRAVDQAPAAEGRRSDQTPQATLADLVLSLAAQASLLLRDPSTPGEGLPAPDPSGARQLIALIEMLEDKTEGRRTSDESRLLDEILCQLRLAYVERTRREA
jgi:hypothetical protein